MATRAIWKGVLKLGKQSVPVRLHSAVTESTVHFHLLHDVDQVRVEQRMVNPETGEPKHGDDVHRAFEVEPGTFVLLTKKELAALEPPPSRNVEVSSFVPAAAIGPEWYERPYYLGPDGTAAEERYFALVQALKEKERVGIVHWVMRKRRYSGALSSDGDHLRLVTLRTLDSVVQPPRGRVKSSVSASENGSRGREQQMAEQLVAALEGPFEPAEYQDEHRKRVLAMIEAKAKGKRIRAPRQKPSRAPSSLASALAASLKHVEGGHSRRRERKSA